jgi:predicted naringenin-chalcone synthase
MTTACINAIGTAVPDHDIHAPFVALARTFLRDEKARKVFDRMAERAGISHRFSFLKPGRIDAGEIDAGGFYQRDPGFPGTHERMNLYATQALELARRAVNALDPGVSAGRDLSSITHLIVASCTGFTAPGLDLQLVDQLGLRRDVERTIVGYMGCAAAIPALRAAHHIVRSDPAARVLVVNVELCTLHLIETDKLEELLSFLLFGDGASAALVTSDRRGIEMEDFRALVLPNSQELITWTIGNHGFLMHLSGQVPARIVQALGAERALPDGSGILRGLEASDIRHWAIHGGGRTVLDAVAQGLSLPQDALAVSRAILNDFGNMSSATVMFVLQRMLRECGEPGRGLAMAFGPGMVAESFRFRLVNPGT